MPRSAVYGPSPRPCFLPRKKKVAAIQQEVTQEIGRLVPVILQDRSKNGKLDMEALETAMRMAMHQVGTAALNQLLRCPPPSREQREVTCSCGQTASYREMRPVASSP